MGLFKSSKKEVAPGIHLSKPLAELWSSFEASKIPAVHISAIPARDLPLTQSKFGGNVLLPAGIPWPANSRGDQLVPLAQLNFSEVPPIEGYPGKGWLQFYTGENSFGKNDFNPIKAENFRVIYFEELDEANARTIIHDPAKSPVLKQHALTFSPAQEYTGIYDIRFEQRFGKHPYDFMESFGKDRKAVERELLRYFRGNQHKIGGYAWFARDSDPRNQHPHLKNYILLLQVMHTPGKGIEWGKKGVGNFFIHPSDLQARNFNNVLFYWDAIGKKPDEQTYTPYMENSR